MPQTDTMRLYGGFRALPQGIDMGTDSSLLGDGQAAFAANLSFRGDMPMTRPPWLSIPLSTALEGRFQGACFYSTPTDWALILSVSGRLYRLELLPPNLGTLTDITPMLPIVTLADFTPPGLGADVVVQVTDEGPFTLGQSLLIDSGTYVVVNRGLQSLTLTYGGGSASSPVPAGAAVLDSLGAQVYLVQSNPSSLDFVWLFQAESFVIVLAHQQATIIYDGSSSKRAASNQVPSGVLGLYAWGRIWVVLSDRRSFAAGDIVYGPSGTPALGFLDAILYFTENDFLNEGGFFAVPSGSGDITAMQALATIDSSLGIGPILVGTPGSVFSVNAPVDRATWKNLTYPIQTVSLLDYGPVGPRFTIPVNNDMWYRSVDGFRSFLVARRDTNAWGNTPLSHEVSPVLAQDTEHLLRHGSMMLFDNRVLATVAPRSTPQGVVHDGLAAINFDPLSSLGGKQPPVWEGLFSGLSIYQLVRGRVQDRERGFALVQGLEGLELWELLTEGVGFYDTYQSVGESGLTLVRTPIQSTLETKRYDFGRLMRLKTAELYLDDIVDELDLTVLWRPDQYPVWTTWATLHLCASVTQCTMPTPGQFSCTIWKPNARTYAARLLLPSPEDSCNELSDTPIDRGYEFQFRIELTGHARLRKFRPHVRVDTDKMEGECPSPEATCITLQDCARPWLSYTVARS